MICKKNHSLFIGIIIIGTASCTPIPIHEDLSPHKNQQAHETESTSSNTSDDTGDDQSQEPDDDKDGLGSQP